MPEEKPGLGPEPVPAHALALSDTQLLHDPPVATPRDTLHVPDLPRFGRFQTTAELGAGAMGTVYQARDEVLHRTVAIKALHAQGDDGIRERFLREARAIGAVDHPNILAIFNAHTDGETPYLVMELASGGSLRDRIAAGPMPVDAVRQLGIQIARALAAAHAANILHRDVKPANILCTQDGAWKLADFGIARLPDSTLTVTGQFLGSPSYAAPESLRAGEFSPAADVYGLGATLYEAVTGAPPYGDHDMRSLIRKLEQEPPRLQDRIAIPPALGDAIMATLARDPALRPSAEQLAGWLAASEASPARPSARPAAPPAVRPRRGKLVVAGLVAALLLAAVIATRGRSQATRGAPLGVPATTARPATGEAEAADPAPDPEGDPSAAQPAVVDEEGNPVDPETARRILDQLQRERGEAPRDRGHGRGRGKYKGRGN